MTTTASYITDTSIFEPFYYLKITGLPYYFGSTIDPTDSTRYGSSAWTLPSGYSWVQGLLPPDGTLEQTLPDLLGGLASSERIAFDLLDFDVTNANGTYSFFGRLLALGRITTDLTAASTLSILATDLPATATTGDTFDVIGTAPLSTGVVYLGSEAIDIASVTSVSGTLYRLTIGTPGRNKYPCSPNYPPTPYYRTTKDADGDVIPGLATIVAQEPISILGRSVALYIGHIRPDGMPEAENQALCRMVGRIKGVDYGKDPGSFQIQVESVMADVATARVAPGLAHGEIQPGYYLAPPAWRTFTYFVRYNAGNGLTTLFGAVTVTIDNGTGNVYGGPADLKDAINATLIANPLTFTISGTPIKVVTSCYVFNPDAGPTFGFRMEAPILGDNWELGITFYEFQPGPLGIPDTRRAGGLLYVLGFSDAGTFVLGNTTATNGTQASSVTAQQPAPAVFVPLESLSGTVTINLLDTQDANGDRFATTQWVSSGLPGLVRTGDGQTINVAGHTATSLTLQSLTDFTTGGRGYVKKFYSVPTGTIATIDQVLNSFGQGGDTVGSLFARLLCSTTAVAADGEFNVFVEGIGLGLNSLVDKDSFRQLIGLFPGRNFILDAASTIDKVFTPVLKEVGAFLVWDVSQGLYALKALTVPSITNASTFVFSESNRATETDRSQASVDYSNIRTGFALTYGWDPIQQKFTAPVITVTDQFAISTYGVSARVEQISDMTIQAFNTDEAGRALALLMTRESFVKQPWVSIQRSVNKTGLTLFPGTYHQIVDNTILNPFSGARGILASDGVYGWLAGVTHKYDDGTVKATFLIDQVDDAPRPWSPTGLLDYSSTAHGYVSSTGVVTLKAHYTADTSGATKDGIDFLVGDKVTLRARENGAASDLSGTVSAIATDGSTATIDTGLGSVTTACETIMILQQYGSQTTARKSTLATRVAFQADGDARLIAGAVRPHKWG